MAELLTRVAFTNSPQPQKKNQRRPPETAAVGAKRMSERVCQNGTVEAVEQADFLAQDVVEYLLNKQASISVNGYTGKLPGHLNKVSPHSHPCLRTASFQEARKRVIEGCEYIMRKHGHEIVAVCEKVSVCDTQLEENLKEALETIWAEPRNWGRLVSLFVVAYYLCEKIHDEEGKPAAEGKIKSIVGWLAQFLKTHAIPWVAERGGFNGVLYGTSIPSKQAVAAATSTAVVDDCKSDYTKASLFVTALGLGAAVVVGTIIGR